MSTPTLATRWQQFRTLPVVVQVLAWVLVGAVSLIIVDDYVWEIGRHWSDRADAIERKVADAGNIEDRKRNARALRAAMTALGPVALPESLARSQDALTEVVNEVFSGYGSVAGLSFDPRGAASMPTVLSNVMGGRKVERISGELRFDATVEDTIAIISELESRPEIEAVTTVRMTRQPAITKLRVNLTIDAWVISEGNTRRRGVTSSV